VPGCCEADAYGAVTSLILQWLGHGPAFVADLVDLEPRDGTGVLWHCGLAPLSMANPDVPARATIHTNRRKPLLNEFSLRPGRVTISRLSQSRRLSRLTIGGGEMLDAPLPFSGTGGVIRFDRPVQDVLNTIMTEGHEHHYGIVYGDVRPQLRALAAQLELPVIEL
jgi:L-fucose isomerase-like protein